LEEKFSARGTRLYMREARLGIDKMPAAWCNTCDTLTGSMFSYLFLARD